MKNYYIIRGNHTNAYNLVWAPKGVEVPGGERISRQEAITYAREERKRRKTNPMFGGYANIYVYPYDCEEANNPNYILRHLDCSGYIVL